MRRADKKRGALQPITETSFCHWSYQSFSLALNVSAPSDTRLLAALLGYAELRQGWLLNAVSNVIPAAIIQFSKTPVADRPAGLGCFDISNLRKFFGFPPALSDAACACVILHVLHQVLPAFIDDAKKVIPKWLDPMRAQEK